VNDDDPMPTGLVSLGRRGLVRVIALYAALTILLLAIPALLAQPRPETPHLSQQEVPTAPGRAR
jgi:hypothetical protein